MHRVKVVLFGILVALLLACVPIWAHEQRTPVVVDTDMALDDVRALTLMLNSPHIEIMAVVTSDGSCTPDTGYDNLRKVLSYLKKDYIPIGFGRRLNVPAPPWRAVSESLGGAELPAVAPKGAKPGKSAVELLSRTLSRSDKPVTYVCLGPMTNLSDLLRRRPSLVKRLAGIYYYGLPPWEPNPGWNTERDRKAAEHVFRSGISIYALHLTSEQLLKFDAGLYQEISKLDSDGAHLISLLHQDAGTQKLLLENHFPAWDETVALCLEDPEIVKFEKIGASYPIYYITEWNRSAARADYLAILAQPAAAALGGRSPVVLESYPVQPPLFQEDIRPLVSQIIARHGLEEWQTTILTNELHRHLGIYSIIGAKMGIRARELLGASLDELSVESSAGSKPPISCLNDGLQVATGASLGRGTITVANTDHPAAEAVFVKGSRRLRMSLKEEVRNQIKSDIQRAIRRYGDFTPEYFKEVRRLSLEYWLNLNRNEIFETYFE